MKKHNIVTRSVIIIISLGLFGIGSNYFFRNFYPKSTNGQDHKNAARFVLQDSFGQKISLESLKGNVVILHFWASWCPPCLEEIPHWVELGTAFQNKPVKLLAVSLDQNWEDAHKILPSNKLSPNIISLLDPEGKVPELYGTFQYPETYLLSRDLKVVLKWVGPQDWQRPDIQEFIERLIHG